MKENEKEVTPEWREKHSKNCAKNFDGSSNAMEAECATVLWKRSVKNFGLKYTTMLRDGDSKSFDAIADAEIYGKDKTIIKEDCINHISKRMGTPFRKLVETTKAQGSSISGRGRLTHEKIIKIQNYYGRAIKDNTNDIQVMRQRIFAILFHLLSTNESPKHMHCPPGPKSWCFWQRAVADGKNPGDHKENDTIPVEVGKKLVLIFQRLSDEDLLKRCSRAKTQNANKSMHNLIWKICPKSNYVGRITIDIAVALAASQFSMGASHKVLLCKMLGIEPGSALQFTSQKKDLKRLRKAERASLPVTKKKRKQLKYRSSVKDTTLKKKEGTTYSAGNFGS